MRNVNRPREWLYGRLDASRPFSVRTTAPVVAVILLAFLHIAVRRYEVLPDGLNYLDMADAFRSGNFALAINAYWSPLYPAILALALTIARATRENETLVAHAANFIIFLGALAAFAGFLRELGRLRQHANATAALPSWFAWLLFAWAVLTLELVGQVTPDLLAAAFFFAAMRLVCLIARGAATLRSCVALGLWLGLAYLAKAAMLPVGAITLVVVGWLTRGRPQFQIASVSAFLLMAAPLITTLSIEKGRLTFSDAPRYAYLWDVERHPVYFPRADLPHQTMKHPPRLVHSAPRVLDFGSALPVSFPLYYDPSYWYEGSDLRIDLRKLTMTVARSGYHLARLLWAPLLVLAVFTFLERHWILSRLRWFVPVLLPAVAGVSLYLPFHIEPRYVAPFAAVGFAAAFTAVTSSSPPGHRRRAAVMMGVLCVWVLSKVVPATLHDLRYLPATDLRTRRGDVYAAVTSALGEHGVREGETVAAISYFGYWARYAGVHARIVAERSEFWQATPQQRACALAAMAAAGARVVVSRNLPVQAFGEGWEKVGDTYAALHPLVGVRCPTNP